MYRTISLCVVLYGCETLSLILKEVLGLRMLKGKVLRKISGPKKCLEEIA
jgi:hypothetical protein